MAAWSSVLLLFVLLATSCTQYASAVAANDSLLHALEWPYSETLVNFTAEVHECAQVSGFEFHSNTTPTALQLSRMCSQPACITLVTESKRLVGLYMISTPTRFSLFRTFATPVLDYCWYYRLPGEPCVANPEMDLYAHFPDKVDACEKRLNVSFRETNGTKFLSAAVTGLSIQFPFGNCSTPCYNLLERAVTVLEEMPCKLGGVETRKKTTGIRLLITWCIANLKGYRYNTFKYHPDWPVPPIPQPTDDDSSSLSGSDVRSGVVDEYEDILEPGSATSSSMPSRVDAVPLPTSKQTALTTVPTMPSSSGSHDSIDSIISSPMSTAAKPTPSAATKIADASDPSEPERPPQDAVVRARQNYAAVVGIPAACFLLLGVILVIFRRKRATKKSENSVTDSEYSSVPSTPTGTPLQDSDAGSSTGLSIQKAFPVDCLQDLRLIGMGSYGVVYLVRDTRNNRLLASKRLVNHQHTAEKMDAFMNEIRLVSTLHHPCVVSFIGATWTNQTNVQALFEFIDGGDLRSYLEATTPVAVNGWTKSKLTIAIDIADALHYVHKQLASPVVHRDLKSPNVLLTTQSPRRAKLSDFGVSRELSSNFSMTTGVGTGRWLAPEVILGGGAYDASCDIYSLGVVLTELDTHQMPFSDVALPEITILSMVALEGRKPTMLKTCPPKILELAMWCMAFKAQERPTAAVVAETLRGILDEVAFEETR